MATSNFGKIPPKRTTIGPGDHRIFNADPDCSHTKKDVWKYLQQHKRYKTDKTPDIITTVCPICAAKKKIRYLPPRLSAAKRAEIKEKRKKNSLGHFGIKTEKDKARMKKFGHFGKRGK